MMYKTLCASLLATLTLGAALVPATANAQDGRDRDRYDNRDSHYQDRRDDHYRDRDYRDNRFRDHSIRREDHYLDRLSDRRQQTKNEWRNIAIGAGAVSVLGLLSHDNTLTFAGAAGALYSLNRYEQDRRSQSRIDHVRSEYFSRPYFYRDGNRYTRRTVSRNGQRYYQFYRG